MVSLKQSKSLKQVVRSVIFELIEENEDLVRRILEEAIEDAFMSKAIRDGRPSRRVSRDRVFSALSNQSR